MLRHFGVVLLAAVSAAVANSGDPPLPSQPPVVSPPTTTPAPTAPTQQPVDVPPTPGKFSRLLWEFRMVDLPARGALSTLGSYGLTGWQLCQVEPFSEIVQGDEGVYRQSNKVRFWLQRPLVPDVAP